MFVCELKILILVYDKLLCAMVRAERPLCSHARKTEVHLMSAVAHVKRLRHVGEQSLQRAAKIAFLRGLSPPHH